MFKRLFFVVIIVTLSFLPCHLGWLMLQLHFKHVWIEYFARILEVFLLFLFDDILIYIKTWEEHLQHLEIVLKTLQEQSLFAKMSKCEFGMKELLYLGHIIGQGVKVHMEKIRAILEWPSPKNITELRGFIGICIYYRKFVKGFSKLTSPLTYLNMKDDFKWDEEA